MKLYLSDSYYAESLDIANRCISELETKTVDLKHSIDTYNNLLIRLATQRQVDTIRMNEHNDALFPNLSCMSDELYPKTKDIRSLIRSRINEEFNCSTNQEVVRMILKTYIDTHPCNKQGPPMTFERTLPFDMRYVIKASLQNLSRKYEFEVTVNYFKCNKLLDVKHGVTVKCFVENYLGVDLEKFM